MRYFGQQGGVSSRSRRSRTNACISAHADYRRDDFIFPRTQSLTMREARWESREKPVKHWGFNLLANLVEMFA